MNPYIIAATLTALATVTASIVTATAMIRSSKRSEKKIVAAVSTPDGVPDMAELMTRLFYETMRQGDELDKLGDRFEEHLGWHEGLSDSGEHP
jgi:hypothetical protein